MYAAVRKVTLGDFSAAQAMVFPEGDCTLIERKREAEAGVGDDDDEKPKKPRAAVNMAMMQALLRVGFLLRVRVCHWLSVQIQFVREFFLSVSTLALSVASVGLDYTATGFRGDMRCCRGCGSFSHSLVYL